MNDISLYSPIFLTALHIIHLLPILIQTWLRIFSPLINLFYLEKVPEYNGVLATVFSALLLFGIDLSIQSDTRQCTEKLDKMYKARGEKIENSPDQTKLQD
ncbi:hypothetical protein HOY80DRAFT_1004796 [Tuber brumale]|nr:hypothetical protein HOY80DRAFT_1004796 [Tuber brumale]